DLAAVAEVGDDELRPSMRLVVDGEVERAPGTGGKVSDDAADADTCHGPRRLRRSGRCRNDDRECEGGHRAAGRTDELLHVSSLHHGGDSAAWSARLDFARAFAI